MNEGNGSGFWTEEWREVGGAALLVRRAGHGKQLLVLHEELGCPGPLRWEKKLAETRSLVVPLHPGFGRTPRVDGIRGVRDLACFYARFLREEKLSPTDVLGFSFGGWVAAEMAANDPLLFSKMVLVGAAGIRPPRGDILDAFLLTGKSYLQASVLDPSKTEEFTSLYGADQTPEQFAAWEEARAETARLAWEPYMFNPSLPMLLGGVQGVPALLLWGEQDGVVPSSAGEAYREALPKAKLVRFPNCGHRPEVEQRERFLGEVQAFLG